MNIFFTITKNLLKKYQRLLISYTSVILFCILIGSIANNLFYNSKLISPFSIAIVDNDQTFETKTLLSTFKDLDYLKNTITIIEASEETAKNALLNNTIAAYIIIPKNFTQGTQTGINPDITAVYDSSNKLRMFSLQLLINSSIGYLTTMQSGVYAVYDKAAGIYEEKKFNKMILDINLEYLSLILNRKDLITHSIISISGNISIFLYYLLKTLIFFVMLNATINADVIQQFLNNNIMRKVKITQLKKSNLYIAAIFANYIIIASNFLIWLILFYIFNIEINLNITNMLCVSAFFFFISLYTTTLSLLIKDIKQLVIINFIISITGMFLAGGIIPSPYLPQALNSISIFTINYWGNNIIRSLIL